MAIRQPQVGERALYTDERKVERPCVVGVVHPGTGTPLIDVYPGDTEEERDSDDNMIGFVTPELDPAEIVAAKLPHDPKGSGSSWRWPAEVNSK